MLGLNVDFNLDLKETHYPIIFNGKNVCIHCGAEGLLVFVDKFGRETNTEVYAFDHIRCKKCGRRYSILWQRDDNGNMYPTADEYSIGQEFKNLINLKNNKRDGSEQFNK